MTCTPLREIPLSRHLEKFSQIFRAERLLATHCLSTVCEFASRAIHKRRRKIKKIGMPGWWYPSQVSAGHEKNSGSKRPESLPLESVPLTRKAVHIRLTRQTEIYNIRKCQNFCICRKLWHLLFILRLS